MALALGDREDMGPVDVKRLESSAYWICQQAGRLDLLEEIFQEALLGAWKAQETHDPERGALEVYQLFKGFYAGRDAIRQATGWRKVGHQQTLLDIELLIQDNASEFFFRCDEPGYDQVECDLLKDWVRQEIIAVTKRRSAHNRAIAMSVLVDGETQLAAGSRFGLTESRASQIVNGVRRTLRRRWFAPGTSSF